MMGSGVATMDAKPAMLPFAQSHRKRTRRSASYASFGTARLAEIPVGNSVRQTSGTGSGPWSLAGEAPSRYRWDVYVPGPPGPRHAGL